jgi:hypothetical protein
MPPIMIEKHQEPNFSLKIIDDALPLRGKYLCNKFKSSISTTVSLT